MFERENKKLEEFYKKKSDLKQRLQKDLIRNGIAHLNLDDGLKNDSRLIRYRITQEQRQSFYREAVFRQSVPVQEKISGIEGDIVT